VAYTFGTSQAAADRLENIAAFFNPLASCFVGEWVTRPVKVAADLGCGPGFTTAMLRRSTAAGTTVGLDIAADFLATAQHQHPHCHFLLHDVTRTPFPIVPEVIYARFLLSHLRDPVAVVNSWVSQLAVNGVLLVEEVEAVETQVEVFRRYLATNEALVASQGAELFVGEALAEGSYDADILCNDVLVLPVPDNQAARWFEPNTRTIWRDSELVRTLVGDQMIEATADELAQLASGGEKASNITWHMRRVVLRRR